MHLNPSSALTLMSQRIVVFTSRSAAPSKVSSNVTKCTGSTRPRRTGSPCLVCPATEHDHGTARGSAMRRLQEAERLTSSTPQRHSSGTAGYDGVPARHCYPLGLRRRRDYRECRENRWTPQTFFWSQTRRGVNCIDLYLAVAPDYSRRLQDRTFFKRMRTEPNVSFVQKRQRIHSPRGWDDRPFLHAAETHMWAARELKQINYTASARLLVEKDRTAVYLFHRHVLGLIISQSKSSGHAHMTSAAGGASSSVRLVVASRCPGLAQVNPDRVGYGTVCSLLGTSSLDLSCSGRHSVDTKPLGVRAPRKMNSLSAAHEETTLRPAKINSCPGLMRGSVPTSDCGTAATGCLVLVEPWSPGAVENLMGLLECAMPVLAERVMH
ncbi:hypothetical protein K469DRAFT_690692 [Zopfia rhizophila CBS 207.26]|uniref:Uncharacterized protein n=1 Tax=Zopfia rhizophila CBS 207.26 TaxID=1314779 RepID=A0A6A6DWL1_9PEZI|nr:hypothetical protein K469DRAFT_690692 [Zopfia rhizophila CBS 207.26]